MAVARMTPARLWVAAMFAFAGLAGGQTTPVAVHGVAFDSVRGVPLGNAFVAIVGRPGSTTADARGRFQFENVPPGTYTFTMQHAVLDSLGLSGISARVAITDGAAEVQLSVPSFGALWRNACGTPAPADSGFVYGTVRDERGAAPVAGATIEATWIDVGVDEKNAIRQRQWRSQTRSDSNGSFTLCGVPAAVGLRVRATTDSAASGDIDLPPSDIRIQRRDLLIGPIAARSTRRGSIAGTVTNGEGTAISGARVSSDDAPEVRTGPDGHFVMRNVAAGTRQLEVLSVGMTPVTTVVDVTADDTARVDIQLKKVTTLAPVRVTETARRREFVRELDDRKKLGFGYTMDSTKIALRGTMESVFREFPATKVISRKGGKFQIVTGTPPHECLATLWIDGVMRVDQEDTGWLDPRDIAVVEVYPHSLTVPARFMRPGSKCGAVVVWTKGMVK